MACAGMAHIGMAYIVAVPRREFFFGFGSGRPRYDINSYGLCGYGACKKAYLVVVPRREDLDLVGLAEVELGPSALLRLVLRQQRQAVASRRALDVPALQDIGMDLIVMALHRYRPI